MKPYYQDGSCTIYHGDCREVMASFTARHFDLLLTDPPYNAGKDYGPHTDDAMGEAEYVEWLKSWFWDARSKSRLAVVFPGNKNLFLWKDMRPSGVGCWYRPNGAVSGVLGTVNWEPWLYWSGDRGLLGGPDVLRHNTAIPDNGHPCPKPESLMRAMLVKCRAKSALDPFMGSGTTLRAAKDLGLEAIGIEIEEKYCEIAAKRLQKD